MSHDHCKTTEKSPGQIAYEQFWAENLPANIQAASWAECSPLLRAAWESVVKARKEFE